MLNQLHEINESVSVEFRWIQSSDSMDQLTEVLNSAYQGLVDLGLNYLAATQAPSMTRKRVTKAHKCLLGLCNGQIMATLSLYDYKPSDKSEWYNKSNVAKIGQFAVLPKYQGLGIGDMMMDIIENQARLLNGIEELALDTAEGAEHLIRYYKSRDYRIVEVIDWDITNYKSVVMTKSL